MGLLPLVFLGAMRFVNSDDHSRSLVPLPDASLALARTKGGRVLSEMLSDTLALARGEPLRRIGEYEWCEPDYRQILLWAEALELEPEELIRRILDQSSLHATCLTSEEDHGTVFQDGRIIGLAWDLDLLPLDTFHWVDGLDIEELTFVSGSDSRQLSCLGVQLPKLRKLYCRALGICELDLSSVPMIRELYCCNNQLSKLDFSNVPEMTTLECDDNKLHGLDLSSVPMLRELYCCANQLRELDFSNVPELTDLWCIANQLTELDIRPLNELAHLEYDAGRTRLIQRPDQKFK